MRAGRMVNGEGWARPNRLSNLAHRSSYGATKATQFAHRPYSFHNNPETTTTHF